MAGPGRYAANSFRKLPSQNQTWLLPTADASRYTGEKDFDATQVCFCLFSNLLIHIFFYLSEGGLQRPRALLSSSPL